MITVSVLLPSKLMDALSFKNQNLEKNFPINKVLIYSGLLQSFFVKIYLSNKKFKTPSNSHINNLLLKTKIVLLNVQVDVILNPKLNEQIKTDRVSDGLILIPEIPCKRIENWQLNVLGREMTVAPSIVKSTAAIAIHFTHLTSCSAEIAI